MRSWRQNNDSSIQLKAFATQMDPQRFQANESFSQDIDFLIWSMSLTPFFCLFCLLFGQCHKTFFLCLFCSNKSASKRQNATLLFGQCPKTPFFSLFCSNKSSLSKRQNATFHQMTSKASSGGDKTRQSGKRPQDFTLRQKTMDLSSIEGFFFKILWNFVRLYRLLIFPPVK